MKKHIIVTKKIWDKKNFNKINKKKYKIFNNINLNKFKKIKPEFIFFIHWSNFIKKNIYENFKCIQFHCSDLPKFRGGSPIQNQILKGINKTKITAFRISKKIDEGDFCKKEKINLNGNVSHILKRVEKKSIKMILNITNKKSLKFNKQKGKISKFKRRTAKDSDITLHKYQKLRKIYDFIRMVDGDGYPNAYLNLQKYKIIFKNSKFKKNNIIGEFKIQKK